MNQIFAEREFGCPVCWPQDPAMAWEARKKMEVNSLLVDESHFIVSIRRCNACSQSYVSVFAERIDWVAGDDPQHWTLMPILPEEVEALCSSAISEAELESLGRRRKSLKRDFPSNGEITTYWSIGISIPPHD